MGDDRVSRLTDKQRECLRLVDDHLSSKEIAPLLSITPEAVDQRLKTAVRVLGVASRFEAARLLARHEGRAYQQTVYEASDVAILPLPPTNPPSAGDEHESGLGEDREDYEPPASFERGSSKLPLPMERGKRNDLSLAQRLTWVVVIAIGAALSFGALLAGFGALAQITDPAR